MPNQNQTLAYPASRVERLHTNGGGTTLATMLAVLAGGRAGVTGAQIAPGGTEIVVTEGVFDLTKATGTAFARDAYVDWDSTNSRVVAAGSGSFYLGRVHAAAATDATIVAVELNAPRPERIISRLASAAEVTAGNAMTIQTGFGQKVGFSSVALFNNSTGAPIAIATKVENSDGTISITTAGGAVILATRVDALVKL
jgi:Uncharacterized conserved protein